MAELSDHPWNTKLIQTRNFCRNQTKDRAVTIRLFQEVAAKARLFIHLVSEIEIAMRFENIPPLTAAHFTQHLGCFFAGNGLVPDRHHVPVPAHLGRLTFSDM